LTFSDETKRPVTGRCLVVHPVLSERGGERAPEARLDEAMRLAEAIQLDVRQAEIINLARPRPATLLGSGAVERLGAAVMGEDVDVVVMDAALSPVQQRNLERAWKCKVIDRTGLILEIFGARARTREGRLQVELAALTYQRSRLVRSWTHLERQRGGFGFLGGPGETQIETDRRMIDNRIHRLKKDLASVRRTRGLHRAARRRVPYPVVALVGYTNAGKSTLFNTLTRADVSSRDQLFATLDPTMRGLKLPSGKTAILSDTVGFVSDLPHELVEAFRATLEEVMEADVILHVRDIAHLDAEAQRADVLAVLDNLGIDEGAQLALVVEVLNKVDLLSPEQRDMAGRRASRANQPVVLVSAVTGEGCEGLLAAVDERLRRLRREIELSLGWEDGATLNWIYERGEILDRRDDEDQVHLRVRLDPADIARLEQRRGARWPSGN
jgi:GTP-binding protein HflX